MTQFGPPILSAESTSQGCGEDKTERATEISPEGDLKTGEAGKATETLARGRNRYIHVSEI